MTEHEDENTRSWVVTDATDAELLAAEVARLRHERIGWEAGAKFIRDERDALRAENERLRGLVECSEDPSLCESVQIERDRLRTALAAVRELHQPGPYTRSVPVFDEFDSPWQSGTECKTCRNHYWPCETAKALAAAEQDEPKPMMRYWIESVEVTEEQARAAEAAGWAKVSEGASADPPWVRLRVVEPKREQ